MFPDLCTRLKHSNKELPQKQVVSVKENDGADGSFVLYHFISLFLRNVQQGNVYVLALRHSRTHYATVLAKLGTQLNKAVDEKRCKFSDIIDEYVQNPGGSSANNESASLRLDVIFEKIVRDLEDFTEGENQNKKRFLFVVDDLSILLDLAENFRTLFAFFVELRRHVLSFGGVLLVTSCAYSNVDIENPHEKLSAAIAHYSNWVLNVEPLATGWSKDVSGQVSIRENEPNIFHSPVVKLLYRLTDRNVVFTSPGLIPGVGI